MEVIDVGNVNARLEAMATTDVKLLAEWGLRDLFFFAKGVLGYKDITEGCHGPVCRFIDTNAAQFKMCLMPRDHLKSSLITIAGNLQLAMRDAEQRILIRNESAANAEKFLRAIRQHCEGNRIFRGLYGHRLHANTKQIRWNDSELDFKREGHYPEPTFSAAGITSATTSRHFTHITDDDPISEDAVQSDKVMADAITRMSGTLPLFVDPSKSTHWLVGTRWALYDVYSVWIKTLGPRLVKMIRAAVEEGVPIWPERFSLETLALKRALLGPYRYSAMMMNNPRDSELQDMNVQDLCTWRLVGEDHLELLTPDGTLKRIVRLSDLDITTTVDPAPAEKITSDRNAVVTVGTTSFGDCIVLEAWGKRCNPLELIQKIIQVRKRWKPRLVAIEGIAYQKAIKYFLKEECKRQNVYINIKELSGQRGSKEDRIRGLQPIMATNRLYINPVDHLLRDEMDQFPLGEHDDVLDALSMQLQVMKHQLSAEALALLAQQREALLSDIDGYGLRSERHAEGYDPEEALLDLWQFKEDRNQQHSILH